MNTYPDVIKGRAIGVVASGGTFGQAAKAVGCDRETVTRWWLVYEELCGRIGRVRAMQRMRVVT